MVQLLLRCLSYTRYTALRLFLRFSSVDGWIYATLLWTVMAHFGRFEEGEFDNFLDASAMLVSKLPFLDYFFSFYVQEVYVY